MLYLISLGLVEVAAFFNNDACKESHDAHLRDFLEPMQNWCLAHRQPVLAHPSGTTSITKHFLSMKEYKPISGYIPVLSPTTKSDAGRSSGCLRDQYTNADQLNLELPNASR